MRQRCTSFDGVVGRRSRPFRPVMRQAVGMATPFNSDEIAAIRATTPGCTDELIHLNHAGSSLPDQQVLDVQIDHLRREAEIGGYEAAAERTDADAAVYDSIADLIGAQQGEIARMEHATAAWNTAFWRFRNERANGSSPTITTTAPTGSRSYERLRSTA